VNVEEQVADLRVTVARIEAAIDAVAKDVKHWADHTRIQNHRLDGVENWIEDRKRDLAHAAGVMAGRAELRRRDLAVLAGIVGAITTLATIAPHIVDIYRAATG
jgi:hypothetical protein